MPIKRRNIVTEVIKLKNCIMKRMEVEVSCSQSAGNIVRRVLNRCEVLGVIACRNNDHSAGVLTGRSLNSRTALCQSVLLGTVYCYTLDLKPVFNKTVSSLVGNSADCRP